MFRESWNCTYKKVELVTLSWNGWPLNRILDLFVGLAFFMIFVQVTLFHYRQNFRHWSMWIPVIATPVFGIFLILYTFYTADWLFYLLTILLCIGVLAGMFGSYVHIRGVGERVGGYELRNFLIGPPLTLPGMVTAMSVLGLIALYWG
jgi:uncharacterized membrane protein HdeD (DUF308 family)